MEIKDFYRRVDKKKIKKVMSSDDPKALNQLVGDGMVELTPEQADYVAGGWSWGGDYDSQDNESY